MSKVDLPTSRASKAELGGRKIYTMRAKTEREARGRGAKEGREGLWESLCQKYNYHI